MGLLKELYAVFIDRESERDAFAPSGNEKRKERGRKRAAARKALCDDMERIIRMLLVGAARRDPQNFPRFSGDDLSDIEPEEFADFIRNDVDRKAYTNLLKQTVIDLADINGQGNGSEGENELAQKTLNALREQAACVYALKGAEKDDGLYLFVSQPEKYEEKVLGGSCGPSIKNVKFEKDLSGFDEQLRFFVDEALKKCKDVSDLATGSGAAEGGLREKTLLVIYFLQKKKLLPFKYAVLTGTDGILGVIYGRLVDRLTVGAVGMTKEEIKNSFIQMTVDLGEDDAAFSTSEVLTKQRVKEKSPRSK